MYRLKTRAVLASEIAAYLNKDLSGDDFSVEGPDALRTPRMLGRRGLPAISGKPLLLITDKPPTAATRQVAGYLLSQAPEVDLAYVLREFFSIAPIHQIHPGARVDPEARSARVEGGCLWGELDRATSAFGMATPGGVVSTTGVGGLTLGGGTGYLTRRHGLTIDNLLGAEVVLADGSTIHASEDEHPDLFWALRGGGGNFGVVTEFEFRLHPVDVVIAGPTFFPLDRAREIAAWYRDFILDAPEDLYGFLAFLSVPPVPVFPAALHGQKACGIIWCWTGPASRADEMFEPVKALRPSFFGVQAMPFPMLQAMHDPLYPPGLQSYWRGDFFDSLSDEALDRHVEFARRMPTPLSTAHLYPIDGAAHRVDPRATAFAYRESNFSQVVVGFDPDPANRKKITDWVREYSRAVHPYSAGGGYVNFLMGDEGGGRLQATYRDNLPRLMEVKRRYDAGNLFRFNHNIAPAPVTGPTATPPQI